MSLFSSSVVFLTRESLGFFIFGSIFSMIVDFNGNCDPFVCGEVHNELDSFTSSVNGAMRV